MPLRTFGSPRRKPKAPASDDVDEASPPPSTPRQKFFATLAQHISGGVPLEGIVKSYTSSTDFEFSKEVTEAEFEIAHRPAKMLLFLSSSPDEKLLLNLFSHDPAVRLEVAEELMIYCGIAQELVVEAFAELAKLLAKRVFQGRTDAMDNDQTSEETYFSGGWWRDLEVDGGGWYAKGEDVRVLLNVEAPFDVEWLLGKLSSESICRDVLMAHLMHTARAYTGASAHTGGYAWRRRSRHARARSSSRRRAAASSAPPRSPC